MKIEDLEKIGKKVDDIVETAVRSRNFQQLNYSITQTVNKTIIQYKSTMPAQKMREAKAKKEQPLLYGKPTGERVKSVLQIIGGGILSGITTLGLFLLSLVLVVLDDSSMTLGMLLLALADVGGAVLISAGCRELGRLGRFKKYIQALGNRTYCDFQQLAAAVGKSVKFVKKDLRKMVKKGWFLQGYVEEESPCLITSHETYRYYIETQKQAEAKKEAENRRQKKEEQMTPETREILNKGNEYIEQIRRSNDAIPGEEISRKISRMEEIVRQIFQRAEAHPEVIPDLKKLMDYYLPMTIKLLNAYEDMDKQIFEGENIRNSKKEIEAALDTLNEAFTQLLDSVFEDLVWDVSSDISVLQTMLAQEGLQKSDFEI